MLTFNALLDKKITNFLGQHDSYGCLAADAPLVYKTIRSTWASVFQDDVLGMFRKHIAHEIPEAVDELPPLPQYGTLDSKQIIKSPYFFS